MTTVLPGYPIVEQLSTHLAAMQKTSIAQLFATDDERLSAMTANAAGLTLDYSYNLISTETLDLFSTLFTQASFFEKQRALFAGENVNNTEDRPALHSAVRSAICAEKGPHVDDINSAYNRAKELVNRIHSQQFTGSNGDVITDVVNIGIGGSYLGPKLACNALKDFDQNKVNIHFVANIDPTEINDCLSQLNPNTTLFIVSSKSFGTEETLCNATIAKSWLGDNCSQHMLAVTANTAKATAFGISEENCLPIWDWVGGRYSIWSNIALPIMLQIGCGQYEQMLAGAYAMDQHFVSEQDLSKNIPLLLASLEIWHNNFQQLNSVAILPYNNRLKMLPDYLQQLTMESNGKSVDIEGNVINYPTNPVVWGSAGTEGQHSFHQLLHQGTQAIPCDFILPLASNSNDESPNDSQRRLIINCLAQRKALRDGKKLGEIAHELLQSGDNSEAAELAPHKVIAGNRPSNLITCDEVTPYTLGAILAMYEHKTFATSVIWNINPFDQWGVELGKKIGVELLAQLDGLADVDIGEAIIQLSK